jgi:uncharacterized cupin superfamily protein
MSHIHLSAIPEEEQRSPGGKFHSWCRNLSLAVGGLRGPGTWGSGHPFDLQIRRIPPGAAVCPLHLHYNQWELFVVRAGSGTVRADGGRHAVTAGDVFVHPPHAAHQLINTGTSDLEVLIIADNPQLDLCYYPDSDKWGGRSFGKVFRITPCDYFDGEEAPAAVRPGVYQPPARPAPPAIPPFAQRRVAIEALAWEIFDSPKRKFRGESKQLSLALGALPNKPTGLGGHPFDLELGKLPPGFSGVPYHSHANQWECYLIVEGTGTMRTAEGDLALGPGDLVMHPPGELHQLRNTGPTDLLFFLVADNPAIDIWRYPDSDKWGHNAPRKIFRATDADYWDGEE